MLLSLLIPVVCTVQAQDFSSLVNQVEKVVAKVKPEWKLTKKDLREKEVIYLWESESKEAEIVLFYGASKQEAAEKMDTSISRISISPSARLENLGEKAWIWIGPPYGYTTIRFRKSNVYVDMTAPSEAKAKELAKRIADLIPDQ
jgi:hypothetical protein